MKKISVFSSVLFFCFSALFSESNFSADQNVYSSQPSYTSKNSSIYWLQDYNQAAAQARSSSKPILILFTGTSWCPACIKLERDVLTRPEFSQAVGDKFIFLKAEFANSSQSYLSQSPYQSLLDRYGVTLFPTMVIVDSQGQLLRKINYRQGGPATYINELIQQNYVNSLPYYQP